MENKLINNKSDHIVLFPFCQRMQHIAESVIIGHVTMLLDTESSKAEPLLSTYYKLSMGRKELTLLYSPCMYR